RGARSRGGAARAAVCVLRASGLRNQSFPTSRTKDAIGRTLAWPRSSRGGTICRQMVASMDPNAHASSEHTVTLRVPDLLYERVQHAAEVLKRSFEDIVLIALATALPPFADLPSEVADDLGGLA